MNSGKIVAGGWTDGWTDIEGSTRGPRGPKKFGAFGIVSLDICFLGTAFVMPLISEYDSDLESSELGRKWTY